MTQALTHRQILSLAWPIAIAQAATALTGIVDTFVMGSTGRKEELAAIAIASVTFSFIYWALGFLRMSTTGLVAQARGKADHTEANTALARGMLLGAALGVAIFALWPLIRLGALSAFDGAPEVENLARGYLNARVFGAPATLTGFAMTGWLIGTGRTRSLLLFQVVLNVTNAALDAVFVLHFDLGVQGIGVGTAIAEWIAAGLGLYLVRSAFGDISGVFNRERLGQMFTANRDIMIRTLLLLFAIYWFTNGGAQLGSAALAGNQVLFQFITVSAFVLDAFAYVAEKEIGEAVGDGERRRLVLAIRRTAELSIMFATAITALYFIGGGWIIRAFIDDPLARESALRYLPYCALIPLIGAPAYQLDGVFIGATRGRALRNAAFVATAGYVALDVLLRDRLGADGLWIAFLFFYVLRGAALGAALPALIRDTTTKRHAANTSDA